MAACSPDKIVSDIKSLKIQGAREIAEAAIRAISLAAERSRASSFDGLEEELSSLGSRLIRARPTEPDLKHIVASIISEVRKEKFSDVKAVKKLVQELCSDWMESMDSMLEEIAEHGAKLVKDGDVILTHCHSHSVVAILKLAKRKGKKFKVIVTETRPLYQGLTTAKELLAAKIPVTYCVDSAIGYFMKRVTKVLTGFDALLLPDGSIVNKIGTLPIAIVAEKFGKPFYAAGETIKSVKYVIIEEREPKEIIDPKKLPGARIINPAFDIVPSELIEAIITEKGTVKPEMVKTMVEEMHSYLLP